MHPHSGVPGFNSTRIYKKIHMSTLSTLARSPPWVRGHFDKTDEIGLKPALVEYWLVIFIVTCKLGLAIRFDQISRA